MFIRQAPLSRPHPLDPPFNKTSSHYTPHFQGLFSQFYPLYGSQNDHPQNYNSGKSLSCSKTSNGSPLPPRYEPLALAFKSFQRTILAFPACGLTALLSAPSPPAPRRNQSCLFSKCGFLSRFLPPSPAELGIHSPLHEVL